MASANGIASGLATALFLRVEDAAFAEVEDDVAKDRVIKDVDVLLLLAALLNVEGRYLVQPEPFRETRIYVGLA